MSTLPASPAPAPDADDAGMARFLDAAAAFCAPPGAAPPVATDTATILMREIVQAEIAFRDAALIAGEANTRLEAAWKREIAARDAFERHKAETLNSLRADMGLDPQPIAFRPSGLPGFPSAPAEVQPA